MDSITHALMGLTVYGTVNKEKVPIKLKKSLFTASIIGSEIPDSDIVFQLTEKGRIMYQMWHRGISHSLLLAPIWALVIYVICFFIWKVYHKMIFMIALFNILLHIGFDALNTWGTGLFEPFSNERISIGIIPIVDVLIFIIMLIGLLVIKLKNIQAKHKVWKVVWMAIALHVGLQAVNGYAIYTNASKTYNQTALSADFVPWKFLIIGKKDDVIEISNKTIWGDIKKIQVLHSQENTDLTPLFETNPKAKVLMKWSPFVVIIDNDDKMGIYDPRFYRKGNSLLFEYMDK